MIHSMSEKREDAAKTGSVSEVYALLGLNLVLSIVVVGIALLFSRKVALVVGIVIGAFVAVIYVKRKGLRLAEALRWKPISFGIAVRCTILGILAGGMTVPITMATRGIIEAAFGPSPARSLVPQLSAGGLVFYLLVGALLVAFCEETLFRGVVQGVLEGRGIRKGVVLTACLFGAVHLYPWGLPSTISFGIVLGVVTVRTNSTVSAMICHASCNSALFVYLFILQRLREDGRFGVSGEQLGGEDVVWLVWLILGLVAALFLLALVELLYRTRHTKWQPSPLAAFAVRARQQ